MIRKLAAASLAAAAATLGFSAGAAHAAAEIPRTCTHVWESQVLASPDCSQVRWDSNSCGWGIQDRSKCRNAQVQVAYFKSGVVYSLGVWAGAACSSTYPQIIAAASRYTTDGGKTWSGWLTYWNL